jgi:hypothetical protein
VLSVCVGVCIREKERERERERAYVVRWVEKVRGCYCENCAGGRRAEWCGSRRWRLRYQCESTQASAATAAAATATATAAATTGSCSATAAATAAAAKQQCAAAALQPGEISKQNALTDSQSNPSHSNTIQINQTILPTPIANQLMLINYL